MRLPRVWFIGAVEAQPALRCRRAARAGAERAGPDCRGAAPAIECRCEQGVERDKRSLHRQDLAAAQALHGGGTAKARPQVGNVDVDAGARLGELAFAETKAVRNHRQVAAKTIGQVAASGKAECDPSRRRFEHERGVADVDRLIGQSEGKAARRRQQPVDLAEAEPTVADPAEHPHARGP
jgi:hypothetical protein